MNQRASAPPDASNTSSGSSASDTAAMAATDVPMSSPAARPTTLSFKEVFLLTSWKNRTLFGISQAGLINNLNDGLAWGLFPLFFAAAGLSVAQIGLLAGIYPGVWSVGQLATGALSDRVGRKGMIVGGMVLQGVAIGLVQLVHGFGWWAAAMLLLGVGTALVYPTLLAAISDVAHPSWRASSVGVYRLWRDSGYAIGAILVGVLSDAFGVSWAIWVVAGVTAFSGILTHFVMTETRHPQQLQQQLNQQRSVASQSS